MDNQTHLALIQASITRAGNEQFHKQGLEGIDHQFSAAGFQEKIACVTELGTMIQDCSEPCRRSLLDALSLVTGGYGGASQTDLDKLLNSSDDVRRSRHLQDVNKWPMMASFVSSQQQLEVQLQLAKSAASTQSGKQSEEASSSTIVRESTQRLATMMDMALKQWVGSDFVFPGREVKAQHDLILDVVRLINMDSPFNFSNVEKELGLPQFRECLRQAVFLRAFHDTVVTSYNEGSKVMTGLVDRRTGNPALVEVVLVFLAGYLSIAFCLEKRLPANKAPELPIPFVFQLMVESALGRLQGITKVTLNNLRLVSPVKEIVAPMLSADASWASAWTDMASFKKRNTEPAVVLFEGAKGSLSTYGDGVHRAKSSASPYRKHGRRDDKVFGRGVQEPREGCTFCKSRGGGRSHTHPLHTCYNFGAEAVKTPDAEALKPFLAQLEKEGHSVPKVPDNWGKKKKKKQGYH